MQDRFTVRLVITTLGVIALAVVAGGIYLTAIDKGLPGELIAIGAASASAVAAILAKTDTAPVESVPVHVTNAERDPVPVTSEDGHTDASLLLVIVAIAVVAAILVGVVVFDLPL